jgi:Domain of unknown function (DUF4347)
VRVGRTKPSQIKPPQRSPGSNAAGDSLLRRAPRARASRGDAAELLFADPAVPDLPTFLSHLRPEVGAIVLDAGRLAARQMAAALEGREDLGAIHVVAHGAPGRVGFSAGAWSAGTPARDAGELAAIGAALGEGGALGLWSCDAGAGAEGFEFIHSLSRAAGRPVAAASHRVGAEALGGNWELNVRTAHAPRESYS